MKPKWIALVAAFALVAVLACLGPAGLVAAAPNEPLVSFIPLYTMLPFSLVVSVPDAALNQALHSAAGVPMGNDLHTNELAALTGTLNLASKGISNAEGLQYCVNISNLLLTNNNLSSLPDTFSNMTKLKILLLEKNKFTDFPAALLDMPGLQEIRFADNKLEELPAGIDSISGLKIMDVSRNKLEALPVNLWKLNDLTAFYCSGNKLTKLPKELFKAPALDSLDASFNKLTSLPAEVKNAPKLSALAIQYNMITKLPAGIGDAPKLQLLIAGFNAISSVDTSLCGGNVKYLLLNGNRIKQLPSQMQGCSYDALNVEWNFMDVSPGSSDRSILTSLTVGSLSYQNQLTPVKMTSSSSTQNSIKLGWKALAGGSSGAVSWEVQKFEVYDGTESPAKLLTTPDDSATGCTLNGLESGREYDLFVRVYYELNSGGSTSQTSCDTYIKIVTEAAAAAAGASTEPAETEQPAAETAPIETSIILEPASAAPATANVPGGGDTTLLVALIIVGALVAIGLVVVIAILLRKKPQTIRIRH
jgi:Leucine-rich repeat (LRR) protein